MGNGNYRFSFSTLWAGRETEQLNDWLRWIQIQHFQVTGRMFFQLLCRKDENIAQIKFWIPINFWFYTEPSSRRLNIPTLVKFRHELCSVLTQCVSNLYREYITCPRFVFSIPCLAAVDVTVVVYLTENTLLFCIWYSGIYYYLISWQCFNWYFFKE